MPADEAAENGLVEDNEDLETGKDLIDIVNEWAKNRGKFKKGSNKNPVTGTGPNDKKKPEEKTDAEADTKTTAGSKDEENNEEAEDKNNIV